MRIVLSRWWEQLRGSLFFVPLVFAVGAAVSAQALLEIDQRVDDLPDGLTSTVDSARALLTVVASATLTFAAIAFSVSLLLISAASSQYSPRVVHGFFRDRFNKNVMGIVVGTFVYCLVVMRAVRGPLEDSGTAVIPNLAVLIGGLLGVIAVLSIVGFIDHAAHSMEVSTMLDRVTHDALGRLPRIEAVDSGQEADQAVPEGEGFVVDFDKHGWVQMIDHGALLHAMAPGATAKVETGAGRYAIPETPICRIWPAPDDEEATIHAVRRAVSIGKSRTYQQDTTFGVRQLADVALKALSPGVNDPTTAQDALFHMGAIVRELLDRPQEPQVQTTEDDRTLILAEEPTPEEIVQLAFDEVRLAAAGQPTVLIYLLEILRLLEESLDEADHGDAIDALCRQAALVAEVGERSDVPQYDHERVKEAFESKFGR